MKAIRPTGSAKSPDIELEDLPGCAQPDAPGHAHSSQVTEATYGLLSVGDVAAMFGRTERTMRRWIARGELAAFRVGRSVFIRSDDVRALISDGIAENALRNLRRLSSDPEILPTPEEQISTRKPLNP